MTKIIGICGGSASGKTTLANKLSKVLEPNASIVSLDNYYKNFKGILEELSSVNFDHPDSLDIELFVSHLKELKEGRSIQMPQYDYSIHSRKGETKRVDTTKYFIVEGLFLYNIGIPDHLFDYKIYINTPDDIRFIRRLIRDQEERARSVESIVNQYLTTVKPMHEAYVLPNKPLADHIFQGENYSTKEVEDLAEQIA